MKNANDLAVFIVDDDASVRDSLSLLLGLRGWRTVCFCDAESFLNTWKPGWAGCLLLDIRMPGMDGLTLQKKLVELGTSLSIILITGHGDVDAARTAFRNQAVDFLEKPLDEQRLIAALEEGLARARTVHQEDAVQGELEQRLKALTPREREVMEKVVAGWHNRDIARELGISVRTAEVHKARMMDKLGTRSVAELVRMALQSGMTVNE